MARKDHRKRSEARKISEFWPLERVFAKKSQAQAFLNDDDAGVSIPHWKAVQKCIEMKAMVDKMTKLGRLGLWMICLLLLSPELEARTWTDTLGRTLEGEIVSQNAEIVRVRLDSGKMVSIPLNKLSEKDLEFLKNPEAGEEKGDAESDEEEKSGGDGAINWDAPWPEVIHYDEDPEIRTVKEDKNTNEFIYESDNYRFTCDVRLSQSVVGTFADMFEATRLYCLALPLGVDGGIKSDGKYDIFLYENEAGYQKAGGLPGSAGVFISGPGKGIVLVPLTSLGVRQVGSGYMRDRDKSDSTLVHELTHQLTPTVYYKKGSRGWFTEGIAEYLAKTPYRQGRFKVRSNLDDIVEYATAYGKDGRRGRAMGEEFQAPALRDFILMSYADFAGARANFNYGFGLLLATYFIHFDGEKDGARLKEFLKALRASGREGKPEEALAKLLDGRSYEELQADITKAWKREGVDINWRSETSSAE